MTCLQSLGCRGLLILWRDCSGLLILRPYRTGITLSAKIRTIYIFDQRKSQGRLIGRTSTSHIDTIMQSGNRANTKSHARGPIVGRMDLFQNDLRDVTRDRTRRYFWRNFHRENRRKIFRLVYKECRNSFVGALHFRAEIRYIEKQIIPPLKTRRGRETRGESKEDEREAEKERENGEKRSDKAAFMSEAEWPRMNLPFYLERLFGEPIMKCGMV